MSVVVKETQFTFYSECNGKKTILCEGNKKDTLDFLDDYINYDTDATYEIEDNEGNFYDHVIMGDKTFLVEMERKS